jgi:hypothetical protein
MTAYSAIDHTPAIGYNFYRLAQVDIDGRTDRSEAVGVWFQGSDAGLVVGPNPVQSGLSVSFVAKQEGLHLLLIKDLTGRTVARWPHPAAKGTFSCNVALKAMDAGSYIAEVIAPSGASLGCEIVVKR